MTENAHKEVMTESDQRKIESRRSRILEELSYSSSKISDLSRIVGFGLVGLIYVFSLSSSPIAQRILLGHWGWIFALSIIGAIVLFLDYLQSLFSYIDNLNALNRIDDLDEKLYTSSITYRLRNLMFFLKQIIAFFGVIIFVVLLAKISNGP
jgi:hypothetical protein